MKKNRKSYKHIYIKTVAAFLSFYIVMMGVVTYVHADNVKQNMQNSIYKYTSEFNETLKDVSSYLYVKNNDSSNSISATNIKIDNVYQKINGIMTTLAQENIYLRATIYDNNDNPIVKTGNTLMFENFITDENNTVLNEDTKKFIFLDNYMSREEINTLFYKVDLWQYFNANITGYSKDELIIPKKIEIYTYGEKGWDDIIILGDKEFNPSGVEGLELEEYNPFMSTTTFFERIGEKGVITPKMEKRYSYCDEIAKPSLDLWRSKQSINGKLINDNVFTGTYGNVLASGGLFRCYINYGVVYYPLEVAIPQLVSVYIYCFIFVLILIFILSYLMIRVFKKQQKLEQNRKDLTNAIAHELKTPLGIIRSYSEGLKENINIDKKDYYLDVIVDETEKMDKMVIEMLNLSKLEANAYELKLETFSLVELTQKEIDKHKSLYNHKGLNIIFNYDNNHEVKADKKGFEYVISNFISNALKHTPNEMNIIINIENSNNKTVFSIENQGDKIPEEKLPRIWDSFYKADESRERKDGGTGLGLAIAKNYLVLHKAQYGCENTENGVKFWFKI